MTKEQWVEMTAHRTTSCFTSYVHKQRKHTAANPAPVPYEHTPHPTPLVKCLPEKPTKTPTRQLNLLTTGSYKLMIGNPPIQKWDVAMKQQVHSLSLMLPSGAVWIITCQLKKKNSSTFWQNTFILFPSES